jgi:hypothetical protein
MLDGNVVLHNRVKGIIEGQVYKFEESTFIKNMSHETGKSLEEMKGLLLAVIVGCKRSSKRLSYFFILAEERTYRKISVNKCSCSGKT